MPAHDKQRIHSGHAGIVTRIVAMCPGARIRSPAGVAQRQRSVCGHATKEPAYSAAYSRPIPGLVPAWSRRRPGLRDQRARQPWLTHPSAGSVGRWVGRCWQSHHVPPGHSSCRRSLQAMQIMT